MGCTNMNKEELKLIDEIRKNLSALIEKRKEPRANEVKMPIVDGKTVLGEEVREKLGCGDVLIRVLEDKDYAYVSKLIYDSSTSKEKGEIING